MIQIEHAVYGVHSNNNSCEVSFEGECTANNSLQVIFNIYFKVAYRQQRSTTFRLLLVFSAVTSRLLIDNNGQQLFGC